MKLAKDMNDLYQRDPEGFESNVMSLVEQAVPAREFVLQRADKGSQASNIHTDDAHDAGPTIFDANRARVTIERLSNPPELARFVVDGLIPADVGVMNGPGSTGKTTFLLSEGVHVVLGRALYGHDTLRPGGVLYISQEDSGDKLIYRLSRIVSEMDLSPGDRERVAEHFFVEDLAHHRVRLVEADERGNLAHTDAADRLIDEYSSTGLSLVIVDPLIFFSAGERHMNDGAAELMLVGRRIARALDCAVQFVHHCSIQGSRDKTDDQYAGRSAAAIADNARFVRNLWPFSALDGVKFGSPPPASVSSEDIAKQRLLVLKSPKISDAPPVTAPTWILRHGWRFSHIENEHRTREEIDREYAARVCGFITTEEGRGVWHTAKTLETAHGGVGIPRNQLRALVNLCEQKGWLIPQEIPETHPFRHARRTHRLTVGLMP